MRALLQVTVLLFALCVGAAYACNDDAQLGLLHFYNASGTSANEARLGSRKYMTVLTGAPKTPLLSSLVSRWPAMAQQ